jgi:Na+(H+)/acetate symporter ActP
MKGLHSAMPVTHLACAEWLRIWGAPAIHDMLAPRYMATITRCLYVV